MGRPSQTNHIVGQPFAPPRVTWPETPHYSFRDGAHELVLFYPDPSVDEVADVGSGDAHFALYERSPLLVLCFRFGRCPWADAPFSWHLVPPEERTTLPASNLTEESRALLQVILVDGSSGIVRALRVLTWSPSFTQTINRAIRMQAAAVFDSSAYDRSLARLYSSRTTLSLVGDAIATTDGGA